MDYVNGFLSKRWRSLFWVLLIFCVLSSLLLFNATVSIAGDDSAYIMRGIEFVRDFKFPSFQGPLYPILLSLPIAIFGVNIMLLKSISILFLAGHFVLLYLTFRGRIPDIILFAILGFSAFNPYLLEYASQTFSEGPYLFFQSLFIYLFVRFIDKYEGKEFDLKQASKGALLIGVAVLMLYLTRHIGLAGLIGAVGYLVFKKKFKLAVAVFAAFICVMGTYQVTKRVVWQQDKAQFSTQGSRILNKDPYDASKGKEELSGFVDRFMENSEIYVSKRMYMILGFVSPDAKEGSGFLAIVTYLLVLLGLFYAVKDNKYLMFTGLYAGVGSVVTFTTLHTRWDQERFVLIFVPLLLAMMLYGLYRLSKKKLSMVLTPLFFIMVLITVSLSVRGTLKRIPDQLIATRHYVKGDIYYGFTRDWVHYLKMCRWSADNLPEEAHVACRKPGNATVYGRGKSFAGIYRINSEDPDTLLSDLQERGVTHIIMANLRLDPNRVTKYTINTVKRYMHIITQKYPNAFTLVHKIGDMEEAYVFKVNYPGNLNP